MIADPGGTGVALLYGDSRAHVFSVEDDVLPLVLEGVAQLCFVPLSDIDVTLVICWCMPDSVLGRTVVDPNRDLGVTPDSVVLVAFEVVKKQWQQHPVVVEGPPGLRRGESLLQCVAPIGVQHITVASTFDYCAAMHLQQTHIWTVQRQISNNNMLKGCSVVLQHLTSISLSAPAVSPQLPQGHGSHGVETEADVSWKLLLTPKYLVLGGIGCLHVYPLTSKTSTKVPGDVAHIPAATPKKHTITFGDPNTDHVVQDLKAVDSSKILILTTDHSLRLVCIYHPFEVDACVCLNTAQKVKAVDLAPVYLNVMQSVGGVPLCYVDCNDNLHFADLQSALNRLETQHQRSHSQDRAITANQLPRNDLALKPTQSVFYLHRVVCMAALSRFMFVANQEHVTLFAVMTKNTLTS